MRKSKDVVCNRCKRVGHYPIMCAYMQQFPNSEQFGQGMGMYGENGGHALGGEAGGEMGGFISGSVSIVDHMERRQLNGNALNTPFTWDQIFEAVLRYADEHLQD